MATAGMMCGPTGNEIGVVEFNTIQLIGVTAGVDNRLSNSGDVVVALFPSHRLRRDTDIASTLLYNRGQGGRELSRPTFAVRGL